mmetsp:Transcript_126272/g.393092  ORF Transcript_126272/g.393092 Transcript_126272/m.393092 type:complete len:157 (+) Transcript_126272:114-584(+)
MPGAFTPLAVVALLASPPCAAVGLWQLSDGSSPSYALGEASPAGAAELLLVPDGTNATTNGTGFSAANVSTHGQAKHRFRLRVMDKGVAIAFVVVFIVVGLCLGMMLLVVDRSSRGSDPTWSWWFDLGLDFGISSVVEEDRAKADRTRYQRERLES